jgi:signal transduction histidine kinase
VRLYQRFVLILLLVAVLPLAIFGIRAFSDAHLSQEETSQFHQYLVTAHAEQVNQFFKSLNLNLSFVVDFERRTAMDYAIRQGILINALTYRRDFEAIVLATADGHELNRVTNDPSQMPDAMALSLQPGFQKALQSRRLQISAPRVDGKKVSFILFYPLSYGPVFCLKADLAALLERLSSVRVGSTGRMWLFDDHSNALLHPETMTPGSLQSVQKIIGTLTPAWEEELQKQDERGTLTKERLEARPLQIGKWVGAMSPVPQMGWTVAFLQEEAEAFHTAGNMRQNAKIWVVVGLLGMLAGSWFMTRDLAKPILKLSHAAMQVAESRFDVQVEPEGPVEMEQLFATFNTMTKRLSEFQDMQVERMLVEKTKLEAVVAGISDGIVIADFRGRLIFSNTQAAQLMNGPEMLPDEAPVEALLRAPGIMQEVNKVITRRYEQASFTAEISSKPEKRYVKGAAVLLRTSQGKDLGVMVALQDVTLDKKIEQLREDFLHMITHDLRGPLTAIQGYTKLLLSDWMGKIAPEMGDILRRSEQATLDLLDMVSNILDVRKYEDGQITLEADPVPVSKLLDEIQERHALVFKMRELQLIFKNDVGSAFVEVDKDLLKRVINNLLGNAAKFTPTGGTVSIHVQAEGNDHLLFQVRDTGRGIPADKIGLLFQKYNQVTTQDRIKGTGLGLSICKMIVEAHGGQIRAASEAGKGALFEFRIPKKQPILRHPTQVSAA